MAKIIDLMLQIIHLFPPFFLSRTIIRSQTLKDGSSIKKLARAMISSMPWRSILQTFQKITFGTGFKKLEKRWNKCADLKGDYIEQN